MNTGLQVRLLPVDGRDDHGATAVLTAIVAVLIFGLAALGVEITNLYQRDRAVQVSVDLAALAGAQGLPDTCQAFALAWDNLTRPDNGVQDDHGHAGFGASSTVAQMRDGNLANGEIQVLRSFDPGTGVVAADQLPTGGCAGTPAAATSDVGPARAVRVITPPRTVDFSFASVFSPTAPGEADVSARASVGIVSSEGASILPVFLPQTCGAGSRYLVVDPGGGGGGPAAPSTPTYDPSGHAQGPVVGSVTPTTTPAGSTVTLTVALSGMRTNPTADAVSVDFHTGTTTTTRVPAAPASLAATLVPGTLTTSGNGGGTRWAGSFRVSVGPAVTSTPGEWKVRARQADGRYTPDGSVGAFAVGSVVPPDPGTGCSGSSSGDFGLLDSDRRVGGPTSQQRELNLISGLDHGLAAFASSALPTVGTACTTDDSPVTARLDNDPDREGNNCVEILNGNQAGLVTDGLVSGGSQPRGRLEQTPSSFQDTCADGEGDGDNRWTSRQGDVLVDTVLSCYLSPGRTLTDVQNGVPGSLRREIFADKRFFFVPIINTSVRPPNGQWPIARFHGAFITDETPTSPATCVSAITCNGLEFNNGGTQLFAVAAMTFPASALPETIDQAGNGVTYIGGTKDFLLLE